MWLHETALNPGQALALPEANERLPQIQCLLLRGDCALKVPVGHAVLLLTLRGGVRVQTGEGQFQLKSRHWMLLDRESGPAILAGRQQVAMVVTLSTAAWRQFHQSGVAEALPGQGRMNRAMLAAIIQAMRAPIAPSGEFWRREPVLRSLFGHVEALQEAVRSLVGRCPGKSRSRRLQVLSRLQRARMYVEGHANRVVRIGELAALTNFSHWYFTKSFHRVYGMSPKDFGIQVRLTQARQLLRDPALTVSEVAAACGFENNSAFARAFRNYFGCPASVLRQGGAPTRRAA